MTSCGFLGLREKQKTTFFGRSNCEIILTEEEVFCGGARGRGSVYVNITFQYEVSLSLLRAWFTY